MRFFFRLLSSVLCVGSVFAVIAALFLWVYLSNLSKELPDTTTLKNYAPPVMTRIYAADGKLLAEYATERRMFLPIEKIPQRVKNAFIAAEDKTFYEHPGVDFRGVLRAVRDNFLNYGTGRRPSGGSTITQQVAKNFFLSSEARFRRKVKELILALRIEQTFTKEQILELYLNEISFGMRAHGIAAAALLYFNKSVEALNLQEIAYLAALPKGPNNYHPYRNRAEAIERRNWVLERMVANGFITAEEVEQAKEAPLQVTLRKTGAHLPDSEYFAEEVRRQLMLMYGEDRVYKGGLSVRSTLDPDLQRMAHAALRKGLVRFDQTRRGWRGPVTHLALPLRDWGDTLSKIPVLEDLSEWRLAVVLSVTDTEAQIGLRPSFEPSGRISEQRETGKISFNGVRWARPAKGPRRFQKPRSVSDVLQPGDVIYVEKEEAKNTKEDAPSLWALRQVPGVSGALIAMDPFTGNVRALSGGFSYSESEFNRATQALRQPGSAFKPFIYAAALDNGYTPSSVIMDAPLEIAQGPGLPTWRPSNYGGKFYGPSTLRSGIELSRNVMTVRLAQDMGMPLISEYSRRFGIYDDLPPFLSMSLGAGETTVLRLTTAYAMLANGGRHVAPNFIARIQDRYGKTIFKTDARLCPKCLASSWMGEEEPVVIDQRPQILDPMTAYQITSMMEGVVRRGTATILRDLDFPVAGKTGTTNEERDAWFIGYSSDLVVGVFVGYDKPKPMGRGTTGGEIAAPIFKDFMKMAVKKQKPSEFPVPPGLQFIPINRRTGLQASPASSDTILEAFKPGMGPPTATSVIDFQEQQGRPAAPATPEAGEAALSGTGGLY